MKTVIQTIGFSIAFAGLGSVAFERAAEYAEQAGLRSPLNLPQGNPGIPAPIRASLRQAFSGN